MMAIKEFKVNDYITIKLEDDETVIFVNEERFDQCKFLLLNIPVENIEDYNEVESIDEASELLDWTEDGQRGIMYDISPEVEFFGHCSNMQAWVENDYDTRILHRNLAFPLLKKLTEVGDPIAKRVFSEEIAKRFESGHPSVVIFLMEGKYEEYLKGEVREEYERKFKDKSLSLRKKTLEETFKSLTFGSKRERESSFDVIKDRIVSIDNSTLVNLLSELHDEGVDDYGLSVLIDRISKKDDLELINDVLSIFFTDEELYDYLEGILLRTIL